MNTDALVTVAAIYGSGMILYLTLAAIHYLIIRGYEYVTGERLDTRK